MTLLLFCLFSGCRPPAESQNIEQNNAHYRAGMEKVRALDYKAAIPCFERAIEDNPRSSLAHFELGLLYDQQENDYPAALYHYEKALKLRPTGYPADNIRLRIPACRQELVKADSLAVLNPAALRETERLRETNQRLEREIESLRLQLAGLPRPSGSLTNSFPPTPPAARSASRAASPAAATTTNPPARFSSTPANSRTITLPPRAGAATITDSRSTARPRTHSVKAGDTAAAIARQYGIPLSALLAANPGLDPKRMSIGHTLNLP
jgi:tetratricopeptide (TPR) repeat protein